MTDEQWYEAYDRNEAQYTEIQAQHQRAFIRWMQNPIGPMPVAPDVEKLQRELFDLYENAPDDEPPDDEIEGLMVAESMATQHRDTMGQKPSYSFPLRHTQTEQYHDSLGEGSSFLLDPSPVEHRAKANALTAVLPRADNPHPTSAHDKMVARDKMARLMAAYREANPDEDFSITEADRARLLGMEGRVDDPANGEGDHAAEPIDASTVQDNETEDEAMDGHAIEGTAEDEMDVDAYPDDETISDQATISAVDEEMN